MSRLLKICFFLCLVRPLVLIGIGLNLRHKQRLPLRGPAVIAANHNSHLDALVLMSLYPLSRLHLIRPAGAADYFFRSRLTTWISTNILGAIRMDRSGAKSPEEVFQPLRESLDRGEVVLLFPEGSRGEPETMGRIRKGIYYLLRDRPEVRLFPVVMHGLGRVLPRGEALFVPFNCDVVIGEPLTLADSAAELVGDIGEAYDRLFTECLTRRTIPCE